MSDVAVLSARLKWQDAHEQYHLELSQQVLALVAENTRLHAENTRMHELLNAYRRTDGGELERTLQWCDAYLSGESTARLEYSATKSSDDSEEEVLKV